MDTHIASRLGLSLVIGLIIGFERGWQTRQHRDEAGDAGIRTFAAASLFGGLAALLSEIGGGAVLAVALAAFAALVVASYVLVSRQTQDFGTTTEIALLVTFALGVLAVRGYEREAVAAAVTVAFLLGLKGETRRLVERVDRDEVAATLQLLLIAAVALPLLPDREYGPWGALNPRTIGLLVLLLAGLSWLGYVATRLLGRRRGVLLTGGLGGLTSSTAVTVTMSRLAQHEGPAAARAAAAAIALASSVMVPRLLVEVSLVNRALLLDLLPPLIALGAIPLLGAVWLSRGVANDPPTAEFAPRNPLELRTAIAYALLLTFFLLLLRVAGQMGEGGVYALASLSGLADVDAAGISLAHSATTHMSAHVAVTGIVLAAVVNTVLKAGVAAVVGGRALARFCAPVLLGAAAVSLLLLFVAR